MDLSQISNRLLLRDGVWYQQNQTEVSYPELGNDTYFEIEDQSFWFTHRNRCIQFLVSRFSKGKLFFDVGGGNGYVSKGIQSSGVCDVVLLEPGLRGILNAQKRGVKNLICSSFMEAGIKQNSLPAVGLFDVIEHVQDDEAFLKKIYESLCPGGYLFITVPAYSFLWSSDDAAAGHFRRYGLGDLKNRLKRNHFEISYSSYMFMFLIFPIFFLKTLPSLMLKQKLSSTIVKQDHAPSVGRSIVDSILKLEFYFFSRFFCVPFGGSCIVVAQKMESK